jgi:hypothetical protein
MSGHDDKHRIRFRPRFSVRALAIFVTLVCIYFGTWELTRQKAESENWSLRVGKYSSSDEYSSPLPLILSRHDTGISYVGGKLLAKWTSHGTHYYLWLFGPKFKLFESTH